MLGLVAAPASAQPLSGLPVPSLTWTDCGGGFQCARAPVPLDYRDLSAGTVTLSLTRKPATDPSRRIGVLFVNPGGPGGSALGLARSVANRGPAELAERFDIVGFDPRGVGESTPVTCQSAAEFQSALASTTTRSTSYPTAVRLGRALVDSCPERLLPYIGTEYTARDMDLLREALGERRLNYLGISFGTYIGTVYANLFPSRIRTLALDGAYDPDAYANRPYDYDRGQFLAVEAALERFFTWCDTSACAFGGGRSREAFVALQNALDKNPVGAVNGVGLTLQVLFELGGGHRRWVRLAEGLRDAQNRTGSLLVENTQADADFYAQNIAVECADRAFPPGQLALQLRLSSSLTPLTGPSIAYSTPTYDHGHATACTQWRAASASRYSGPFNAPGTPPILVVGTVGDPDTPFQDAVTLASALGNGHLLVSRTEGHSGYGNSTCARSALAAYLVSRVVPAPGFVCDDDLPPS